MGRNAVRWYYGTFDGPAIYRPSIAITLIKRDYLQLHHIAEPAGEHCKKCILRVLLEWKISLLTSPAIIFETAFIHCYWIWNAE